MSATQSLASVGAQDRDGSAARCRPSDYRPMSAARSRRARELFRSIPGARCWGSADGRVCVSRFGQLLSHADAPVAAREVTGGPCHVVDSSRHRGLLARFCGARMGFDEVAQFADAPECAPHGARRQWRVLRGELWAHRSIPILADPIRVTGHRHWNHSPLQHAGQMISPHSGHALRAYSPYSSSDAHWVPMGQGESPAPSSRL